MNLLFALITLNVASGFAPKAFVRQSTSLLARPDATAAIAAAVAASNEHGPSSPEAKVAWSLVEELDSSDNR